MSEKKCDIVGKYFKMYVAERKLRYLIEDFISVPMYLYIISWLRIIRIETQN